MKNNNFHSWQHSAEVVQLSCDPIPVLFSHHRRLLGMFLGSQYSATFLQMCGNNIDKIHVLTKRKDTTILKFTLLCYPQMSMMEFFKSEKSWSLDVHVMGRVSCILRWLPHIWEYDWRLRVSLSNCIFSLLHSVTLSFTPSASVTDISMRVMHIQIFRSVTFQCKPSMMNFLLTCRLQMTWQFKNDPKFLFYWNITAGMTRVCLLRLEQKQCLMAWTWR